MTQDGARASKWGPPPDSTQQTASVAIAAIARSIETQIQNPSTNVDQNFVSLEFDINDSPVSM